MAQLPASFQALRREDGQIDRDALDADFDELVDAIGLGAVRGSAELKT